MALPPSPDSYGVTAMRNLGRTAGATLLIAALGACGDVTGAIGDSSTRARADVGVESGSGGAVTAGGGTYGSGGNLIPAGAYTAATVTPEGDGGGTYGSGGKATTDTAGEVTTGSAAGTPTECGTGEEEGGGTYGSGGRSVPCVTGPTP